MRSEPIWRRYLRLLGSDPSADVEDELTFHLSMRVEDLMRRGLGEDQARAQAEREFGDVGRVRREMKEIGERRQRRSDRAQGWESIWQDLRFAVRTLLRSPGFTMIAILTLGLGIGATTAIFTVVDAVLLRPLGAADPEELVILTEYRNEAGDLSRAGGAASPANLFDWESQSRSFSSMSYFVQWPQNLTGDGEPQEVQVQFSRGNLFSTLGVQPLLGRVFTAADELEPSGGGLGFGDVAVLSHRLWQSRYGGDPGIVGKRVLVNGEPREVIGVMGPDFRVLDQKPDLWIPLGITPGNRTSQGRFLVALARLKPGVGPAMAGEEMTAIARRLEAEYPDYNTGWSVAAVPMREKVIGQVRPALLVLLGAVSLLLLIACTNVANLLLGRATARRQETAVRLSLGATRGRLVRQLLTESLVLSLAGGLVGLTAAVLGTRAIVRSLPPTVQLPRLDTISVDGRVLAFTLAITILTGILFGLVPALSASRPDLQGALRSVSRGSTAGSSTMRLRNGLVVAQVALALMLLVGAGLLMRSFQMLQAVDTGVDPRGVLTLRMSLGGESYGTGEARRGLLGQLLPALQGLPGVQAVGTVSHLPLTEGKMGHLAYRPDLPPPAPGEEPSVDIRIVGGEYFAAQGVPLMAGRTFDERDHVDAAPAFIINQALARQQFPGEDPVGKRLVYPWPDLIEGVIVGVVGDVRETSVVESPSPALYRSFSQWTATNLNVVIRTAGDPLALAGAARAAVQQADPNLPVASIRTMEEVVAEATARSRMSSYLLGTFAVLALLLAAIGLYGVVAYAVTQRKGEIGVRVALGASRGNILRLIVGQGMLLTMLGVGVGLLLALALSGLLRSLLFGVTATDAVTFITVPVVLAGVALIASYLPASRAARSDPVSALRA